jgi:integrase
LTLYPKASGATRNRQVIVPTQAIINHAASLDLCKHLKVERFPTQKKLKQPVTWEWVQAFMAHSVPHLGALCCFMFLTGARVTEAIELTWDDVDLVARRAIIKQGKLNKEERRPFLWQQSLISRATGITMIRCSNILPGIRPSRNGTRPSNGRK